MNQGGNAVILDGGNSYMIHKKTGKKTNIIHENGQYIMHIWIWEGKTAQGGQAEKGIRCSNRYECLGENGQEEEGTMGFMRPDDAW
jgi:hypothetical protein